jgi:O-antigen/teichoic acid export membrane protein
MRKRGPSGILPQLKINPSSALYRLREGQHHMRIGFAEFGRSRLVHYLGNVGWLVAARAFSTVTTLLVGIWVARYLGPTQLGYLAYAGAIVGILSPILLLGLNSYLVKELVARPGETSVLLGTSFWAINVVSSLFLLGFVLVANTLTTEPLLAACLLIFAAAQVFNGFKVIEFYFQAKVANKLIALYQISVTGASALLQLVLLLLSAPLIWFALAGVASQAVGAAAFIYLYRSAHGPTFKLQFRSAILLRLVSRSWPYALSGVVVGAYMKVDQVMIQQLLSSTEAVGLYSVAVGLSSYWYFLPVAIVQTFYPAIARAKGRDEGEYQSQLHKLNVGLIWLSIAVAGTITLIAEPLLVLLYGGDFRAAATALSVHVWAGVLISAALVRGKWLLTEGLERFALYSVVGGFAVNVALNLIFIPTIGITGAAWATLLARASSIYLMGWLFPVTRPSVSAFHRALAAPLTMILSRVRPALRIIT